jgi:SAM-dependent methyltransferase
MTDSSCHGAPLPLPQGMTDLLARLDHDARILDFGCGAGTSVSSLVAGGWDAWGLDISEEHLAKASDRSRLLLAEGGRSPFDDASFDLIVTHQVLEHVRDLRSVVAEIARLTKPGGYGLHEWPGKWRPVEPHFNMPLVHWLPKNGVRRAAITMFVFAGIGKRSPYKSGRRLAEHRHLYSVNETFYRPAHAVFETFAAAGFDVETISHSKLKSFPLGPTRPLAEWAMRTFRTVTLQTTKPTDART